MVATTEPVELHAAALPSTGCWPKVQLAVVEAGASAGAVALGDGPALALVLRRVLAPDVAWGFQRWTSLVKIA